MSEGLEPREAALELLYAQESLTIEPGAAVGRVGRIVNGVLSSLEQIDSEIEGAAERWSVARMPLVDRNILRLAMYEMLFREDIPPVVSINEAVEIAKQFSTRESGAFVNGILDRLKTDLPRPARTAARTTE